MPTLDGLQKTSKDYDTPRDALLEHSIQRLLPLIEIERDKHEKRKEILRELAEYTRQGRSLLKKSEETLGRGDPITDTFDSALGSLLNAYRNLEDYVEKGRIIEDF